MSDKKPIIVCTEHRGVFFGFSDRDPEEITRDKVVSLTGARMAIYWGTDNGVMQLADTGPTDKSKIGAPADISLNAVTSVFSVTDDAAKAWVAA